MATANVKLYYGTTLKPWLLTANKFFVIDDISSYLSTFTPVELNNFQYLKCTLELSIVCDLSQVYSEPLYVNGIKYVAIKNSDANKTYYYFVKNAEWRAKQSVKLFLVMDVANTFRAGTDFDFTEKTKITREHKNRIHLRKEELYVDDLETTAGYDAESGYLYISTWFSGEFEDEEIAFYNAYGGSVVLEYIYNGTLGRNLTPEEYWDVEISVQGANEYNQLYGSLNIRIPMAMGQDDFTIGLKVVCISNKYTRVIDLQSEGLAPILYKKSDYRITRDGILNKDWYLLYRNQNDPSDSLVNPVECYLIPSEEITANIGSIQSGGRINPDNLESGKYYYIPLLALQTRTITLSNGITLAFTSPSGTYHNAYVIAQKADNNHIMVYSTKTAPGNVNGLYFVEECYVCDYFNISALPCKYMTKTTLIDYEASDISSWTGIQEWTSEGTSPYVLDGIDKLDRTDAKNIKLIKLPYIPYNFSVSGGKLVITDTDFEHVSLTQSGGGIIEVLKLTNLNVKFNYNFEAGRSPYSVISVGTHTFNVNELRNDLFESKIYHSDFYQTKFVYDSFSYVFQLERMDLYSYETLSIWYQASMRVKYVVSTTMNSRFMFQFIDYVSYVGKEDYNNVMPVARNNEIVLYNVPYINYIRSGYNYDVKNKNTQAASTWASVGLGAITTAAALLFPSTALKVAGVVASLISTASAVKNAVVSQVQAERNLDEKMLNAKNQITSVSGSDDVDLMSVYTENRAKLCYYSVSNVVKELLYDLFFYTGYVSNRMGLPNTHTRINFDYLEADILIDDHVNMGNDIMNELVGLYKNGLTFIHKVSDRVSEPWDLEQKYENYELNMVS